MDFSTNGIVTVIPAYRVQDTIASVLKDLPAYIEHIIVVDDTSPDSSANLVAAAAQQDSRIVLVRHEKNQGVGGAIALAMPLWFGFDAQAQVTPDSALGLKVAFVAWPCALLAPMLLSRAEQQAVARCLLRARTWSAA